MTLGHATGDDRCGTSVRRGVRVAAHSPRRGRLVLKTAKLYSVRFGIQKLSGTLSFWNSSVHVTQTLSCPRHTPVQAFWREMHTLFLQNNYFLASDLLRIDLQVPKPVLTFVSVTEKCKMWTLQSFRGFSPTSKSGCSCSEQYRKPSKIL